MRFVLAFALLLTAAAAHAQCPNGRCPRPAMGFQAGQPVKNVARAAVAVPVTVAKAAVAIPVRTVGRCCHAAANFHQHRKAARHSRRASRRAHRGCH